MKRSVVISVLAGAVLMASVSCEEKHPAPSISIEPTSISVPGEGGTYQVSITSNSSWSALHDVEYIEVSPASGEGDATVNITVGQNPLEGTATSFNVVFTCTSGESTATATLTVNQEAAQPENTVLIDGELYQTAVLADGRTWMVENLRYIPDGMTVSSDPADGSGLWYPNFGSDVAMTDADSIAKYGLLYSPFTAMGIEPGDVNESNYTSFEGTQGICPDGWHIPTQAEAEALIQAYWDDDQEGASIDNLDAAGFNTVLGGFVQRNNSGATGRYSSAMPGYIILSTGNSYTVNDEGVITSQNKGLMKTVTTKYQRFTVANIANYGGANVRCIKDAE